MDSGFCDEGHLQYYQDRKKGAPVLLTTKKKLKLLKGLSKNASLFSELGFALDPDKRALFHDHQGNLTSDGTDVLLKEIEKLKAEEKELKRKKKQEKKAKLKASKSKTGGDCESSSSSSSSESSDSDCDEVVDMNSFRTSVGVDAPAVPVVELHPPTPQSTIVENPVAVLLEHHLNIESCSRGDTPVSSISVGFKNEKSVVSVAPQKRIEVCMGNKCKRSGSAALLQEFERVVGVEGGAVVGCKCMGKCKSAPNVRIQNSSVDHNSLAEGLNDSVKVPANPLCIGVGLEDVHAIVARFLGENHEGMAAAT